MAWYGEALWFTFTGYKGPSQTPEKKLHTIRLPPPNITVGTMQSSRWCSPGIRQTQTWPSDHKTEKCYSSLHRTGFHCCSIVQWWCALHHSIWRLALCWWCEAGMQLFNHGNPFFEAPATQFFFRYQCQLKFGILQLWNQPSVGNFTHHAPQHSATLFCDFMWYSASWLSCFSF